MKQKCPDCKGEGVIVTQKSTYKCCNRPTESGECCGSPNQDVDVDYEPCIRCDTTGEIEMQPDF